MSIPQPQFEEWGIDPKFSLQLSDEEKYHITFYASNVSTIPCKACKRTSKLLFDDCYDPATGFPQFRHTRCQHWCIPVEWPPRTMLAKYQRKCPTPPSPRSSNSSTTSTPTKDDNIQSLQNMVKSLQQTIESLQQTIAHMATSIADLSALKATVTQHEDRLHQIEHPKHTPPHQSPATQNTETPTRHSTTTNTQHPKSYADKVKTKKRIRSTPKSAKSASVAFQTPPSEPRTYEIVYIAVRHRMDRSAVRKHLRSLDIHTGRIIDIHFPARHTIGLLVHQDYSPLLRSRFLNHKVPLLEFDPCSPSVLADPRFVNLDEKSKRIEASKLHKQRLLRALQHVRDHQYWPLANAMILEGWLCHEDITKIDNLKNTNMED